MIFFEDSDYTVFFGDKSSNIQILIEQFSEFNFKRIKQVHGDKSVHTSPHSIDFSKEADAHYTGERKLALTIATADCIPVMIYHPEPRWISAIHAGWRGVLNRIVIKNIDSLKRNGCKANQMKIFIGPHIGFESFEVENSIRDQLLATSSRVLANAHRPSRDGRSLVSLIDILRAQLEDAGVESVNIQSQIENTVTNIDYHSYRRDKENSGRQLSFIALK